MALVVGTAAGTDSKISTEKVRGYKHFANKLWNISRFILENCENVSPHTKTSETDQKLLDELAALGKEITTDMEEYRFHLASEKIYHFVWDRLASEILEESKVLFKDGSPSTTLGESRRKTLLELLKTSLLLLHPFTPFVTEEIWGSLPGSTGFIMVEKWPNS